MTEKDYWLALEYRLDREFDGMPRKHRGTLWCDGLCPEVYLLTDEPPRILGHAWIGYISKNTSEWKFTLFLPKPFQSLDEIDLASLLPPDNKTCWIAIDEPKCVLQIEPAAAVPDLD